jgi:hypothetical protein
MSYSAVYVRFRLSIIKTETPLTVWQEKLSCSQVSGTRRRQVCTKERTTTKYRNLSPARDKYPYPKEFYLFLWGSQRPQECKEF